MSDQEMNTQESPATTMAPAETESTPAPAVTEETAPAAAPATKAVVLKNAEFAYQSSMNTLYLSAFSFILGVLFTVLILLILDFMRRNSNDAEK